MKIALAIEMGVAPLITHNFMEFLVVDYCFAYHGAIERPSLKEIWVVTSIRHLYMKFPTENRIATVKGDKRSIRECCSLSIRKAEPRDVNFILMDIDEVDDPVQGRNHEQGNAVEIIDASEEEAVFEEPSAPEEGEAAGKVADYDELDPLIIDCEPRIAPVRS